jgi:phage tail-like protein
VIVRGVLEGLESPHPIGMRLPGLYADDAMAQRFTAALDEVLAPVFATLDCLPAYLDPRLAPDDFVDWLAGWVGLVPDDTGAATRRRELVARAAAVHPWRGTRRGLAEHVRLVVGGSESAATVEVVDGGGAAWSATPGAAPPGTGRREVLVRVRAPDPRAVDRAGLEALVALLVPAHLVPVVEVLPTPDVPLPRRPGAPTDPPPGRPVPPGAGHRHDGPGDAGQPGSGA